MFEGVRNRFLSGKQYSAADYIRAWHQLDAYRDQFAKRTASFDAVLLPTCAMIPPNAIRLIDDADYFQTYNLEALKKTRIGNLMGSCGLTLPTSTLYHPKAKRSDLQSQLLKAYDRKLHQCRY